MHLGIPERNFVILKEVDCIYQFRILNAGGGWLLLGREEIKSVW